MATQQELMDSAKAYIQAKQYEKARKILKGIKHPTAEKWLAKVDELSPPPSMVGPFKEKDLWDWGILFVIVLILSAITSTLYYNAGAIRGDDESYRTFLLSILFYSTCAFIAYRRMRKP